MSNYHHLPPHVCPHTTLLPLIKLNWAVFFQKQLTSHINWTREGFKCIFKQNFMTHLKKFGVGGPGRRAPVGTTPLPTILLPHLTSPHPTTPTMWRKLTLLIYTILKRKCNSNKTKDAWSATSALKHPLQVRTVKTSTWSGSHFYSAP